MEATILIQILLLFSLQQTEGSDAADFMREMLRVHNEVRQYHQNTPPLVIDHELIAKAQKCADIAAQKKKGEHCTGQGENIAGSYQKDLRSIAEDVMYESPKSPYDGWYTEGIGSKHGSGWKFGVDGPPGDHFTQVVWKNSKRLGCAQAKTQKSGHTITYVVCNYFPFGNVDSQAQFDENVRPLKGDICPRGRGWISGGSGGCYQFITEKLSWHRANDWCTAWASLKTLERVGSRLVEINSKEQNNALYKEARNQNMKQVWIGLSDLTKEGDFKWTGDHGIGGTDGRRPTYTNWTPNNPNNWDGKEDCAILNTEARTPSGKSYRTIKQWNDGDCSEKKNAICQLTPPFPKDALFNLNDLD